MMRFFALTILIVCSMLGAAVADPLPPGFENHKFNRADNEPVAKNGVITFHIENRGCSDVDYGDGRGFSDCKEGNVRSIIRRMKNIPVGEAVEYRFDVRVDPSIKYPGFHGTDANGYYPNGIDSRLRIASWEGPFLYNFIYMLKADTTNGISFLARTCQSPDKMGEWVTFSLKTLWTADNRGWVKASCNGKMIYSDEDVATDQAPQCWRGNECLPETTRNPKNFNFILGPVMMGFGPDFAKMGGKSVFTDVQPDGITVQMRNVSVTSGAKLYDAADTALVKKLQERLSALGCDPGATDGVINDQTRQAALACRKFPANTLPAKLTLATATEFLAAYNKDDATSLPRGQIKATIGALPPPSTSILIAEAGANKLGTDPRVESNFFGTVKSGKKSYELEFILLGDYDLDKDLISNIHFILQANMDKSAVSAVADCGVSLDKFSDGSLHPNIRLKQITDTSFGPPDNINCIRKALPPNFAFEVDYLFQHFRDIPLQMIKSHKWELVRHVGVKSFLNRVAAGEIVVGG